MVVKENNATAATLSGSYIVGSYMNSSSTYPGCDSQDIILDNGQIWAACNVGAKKAFNGFQPGGKEDDPLPTEENAGKFFQWGEKTAWDYTGEYSSKNNCEWNRDSQSCLNSKEDSWPGSVSDDSIDLSRWLDWGELDTRGPCGIGYRVPTNIEWENALKTLVTHDKFASTLKMPQSGYVSGGSLIAKGGDGNYWSITGLGTGIAGYFNIYTNGINTNTNGRTNGFSIRCIKN